MALGAGRRLRREADNPLPGDPAMQNQLDAQRRGMGDASGIAGNQYQQDRAGMSTALAGLEGLANGTGPSLAQEQLANQSEKNIAATMAAMGSARGGNLNAAQMGAATAGVGMAQETNQAMAELRAREQIDALNASGGLASAMAGMSTGRQMDFAGMGQQALLAGYDMANQREMTRAGMVADRLDQRNKNRLDWTKFGFNAAGHVLGAAGSAATGGAAAGASAFSDVRVKCKIKDAPSIAAVLASMGEDDEDEDGGCEICGPSCKCGVIDELLSSYEEGVDDDDDDGPLGAVMGYFSPGQRAGASDEMSRVKPYTFEYDEQAKAHGMPEGEIVGVMAQDLERAGPRGRAAVYEHPAGPKALHPAKSIGLALAAAADHEGRMRKLESMLGIDPHDPSAVVVVNPSGKAGA